MGTEAQAKIALNMIKRMLRKNHSSQIPGEGKYYQAQLVDFVRDNFIYGLLLSTIFSDFFDSGNFCFFLAERHSVKNQAFQALFDPISDFLGELHLQTLQIGSIGEGLILVVVEIWTAPRQVDCRTTVIYGNELPFLLKVRV